MSPYQALEKQVDNSCLRQRTKKMYECDRLRDLNKDKHMRCVVLARKAHHSCMQNSLKVPYKTVKEV